MVRGLYVSFGERHLQKSEYILRRCWVHAAAAVRVGGETAVVVINVEIFHMDWKLEHLSQISRHHSAREL